MYSFSRTIQNLPKLHRNRILFFRKYANFTIHEDDMSSIPKASIEFFMNVFETKSPVRVRSILMKQEKLKEMDQEEIANSINFLKSQNISIENIIENSNILVQSVITTQNRYIVLNECGFTQIDASHLSKFVSIMNKPIFVLKAYKYIPQSMNLIDRLCKYLSQENLYEDDELGDTFALKTLRRALIMEYLSVNLNITMEQMEKIWKTYPTLKHKPLQHIVDVLDVLRNDLKLSNEKICGNPYLLYAEPENLRNIIYKLKTIGGVDCRYILEKRPKIAMTNYKRLDAVQKHIRSFGIPDVAIIKCLEILTLGPDTVYDRLLELKKTKEFDVLIKHPRILRLVHYQNKALIRLEYLKQMKIKCVSLHILSSSSDSFEKYVREGSDKTMGRDVIITLANIFNCDENVVRNSLTRHSNWCHVSVVSIRSTLDFLKYRDFDLKTIFDNIHILLYPVDRIDAQLNALKDNQKYSHLTTEPLTKNQRLRLCVYLMELEFHFTGDGIWMEPVPHTETYHTIPEMPESLTKEYKFGKMPTTRKLLNYM